MRRSQKRASHAQTNRIQIKRSTENEREIPTLAPLTPVAAHKKMLSASLTKSDALQMQRLVGNRALTSVKRILPEGITNLNNSSASLVGQIKKSIQREPNTNRSQNAGFDPFDRTMLFDFVQEENARAEAPLRTWLDDHIHFLRQYGLDDLVRLAKRMVDSARQLPGQQVQAVIQERATHHGITIPRISIIPLSPVEEMSPTFGIDFNQIADELEGLLDIPTEIKVEEEHGMAKIELSGAAVELRQGQARSGGMINWDGTLGIHAAVDNFGFSASLSGERWQMGFTYATGGPTPSLSSLHSIFQQGEIGIRNLMAATANFQNINEIPALQQAITSNFKSVKAAIKAAQQIAEAEQDTIYFNVSAEGRSPASSDKNIPEYQFTATLTVLF